MKKSAMTTTCKCLCFCLTAGDDDTFELEEGEWIPDESHDEGLSLIIVTIDHSTSFLILYLSISVSFNHLLCTDV